MLTIFRRSEKMRTAYATLAAAGTTQTDATLLDSGIAVRFDVTAADGAKGVKLPAAVALYGNTVELYNNSASPLLVYPASGDDINDNTADLPIILPGRCSAQFCAVDAATWYCDHSSRQLSVVIPKTADYTVTVAESGRTFTTVGAAGTVVFSLPAAVLGLKYRFRVGAAQELRIDPNGSEVIALPSTGVAGAAGKYLTANADGETVDIECTKAGQWSVFGFTGTWTAEA